MSTGAIGYNRLVSIRDVQSVARGRLSFLSH